MTLRPRPWLISCLSLLSASVAVGAVCNQTVTTTSDGGAGSLRNAIAATLPGQFVCIDPSLAGKTITLASQIAIDQDVTVLGPSPVDTAVSAAGLDRVFEIQSGAAVTLTHLTIRDGFMDGFGDGGAGVRVDAGATLTMNDCTVTACTSGAGGAGVRNDGILVMNRCTLYGNRATGGNGGGVRNAAGADLTSTSSTITGNTAVNGGGVDNDGSGATAVIHSSTIAYNAAAGDGGGIHTSEGDAEAVTIDQSIVWGNTAGVGRDLTGTLVSADYNMIGTTSGASLGGVSTHDLVGVDPKLGSPLFNGGTTRTLALSPGSQAIDRIPSASCTQTVDQRGASRPADGDANGIAACDVGAYEASRPLVVTSLADPGDSGTCTLRQALDSASTNTVHGTCVADAFHAGTPPDRITFAVTGTIHLASGVLTASQAVIIDGPGAPSLTIDGGHASTILSFANGSDANAYVVSGVTLANGGAAATDTVGGISASLGADDAIAIDRSTFRDNVSTAYGSLYVIGARVADVARSTIVDSSTSGVTGLAFFNTEATMTNTTVADTKSTVAAVFVSAFGAGAVSTLTIRNSTVSGSEPIGIRADAANGASAGSGRCRYGGSVISAHALQFESVFGAFTSLGDNVVSDATGGSPATGDATSVDPLLGPLSYNGGPTPTFGLKTGSPAIGRVPIGDLALAVDQRGFARPFGAAADSGATERTPGGDVDGNGTINVADVFYLINFLFAGGPPPVGIADPNGDASVDVADVFYLINYLFASGPAPV